MATPKNWRQIEFAANQWTTLVADAGAVLSAVLMANNTGTAINVQMRLATNAGVALSTLLPPHTIAGYGADVLNLQSLAIEADQQVQIWCDAVGIHAVATGVL